MTLHQSIEAAKKFLLGVIAGIILIIILTFLYRLTIIAKNALFPGKITPANHLYDKVPALKFPKNSISDKLTYKLNTLSGTLPQFPDRLEIFPITQPQPNLLNLQKARDKAKKLGFTADDGSASNETNLGNDTYQWTHSDELQKALSMNIISFNFSYTTNFLSSQTVQEAKSINNIKDAIDTAKSFLENISLAPTDIDDSLTSQASNDTPYFTQPQLFSIKDNALVPATSISTTQVIRVDLYQKDMTYNLDTGIPDPNGGNKNIAMDLPILYPHPPYSPMNFLVASGGLSSKVYGANFKHQTVVVPTDNVAVYPIKTSQKAFDELTKGKGYIAAYSGSDNTITITNVILAYYLGEDPQQYLMPIIVFEGNDGFFAYVSAVSDEWIQK